MSDKKRAPRDIWKQPPTGSEGDAAKDYESAEHPAEEAREDPNEPAAYEPKHRAPGRAPLIRRRRSRAGDEETVSWETSWTKEPPPPRWTDEQEPSITPPPRPIEEVPYLGPRRTELKKKRARPAGEGSDPETPRSREYTGRHLAPKKARWSRAAGTEVEDLPAPAEDDPTLVEGDVEDPRDADAVDEAASPVGSTVEEVAGAPEQHDDPSDRDDDDSEQEAAATEPGGAARHRTRATAPAPETAAEATVEEHDPPVAEDPAAPGPEAAPVPIAPAPPSPRSGEVQEISDAAIELPGAEDDDGLAVEADEEEPLEEEQRDEAETDEDETDEEEAQVALGPRRAALERRRKKKRALQSLLVALAVLGATAGVVGAGFLVKEAVQDPQQRAVVPLDQPRQEEDISGTTLFFGTKEKADPSRGAIWMTLVTVDAEGEQGSVVYLPAHTAVEVPGRGLQGVGESYGSGGVPLLLVSAENLLGINIDRYVELSDKDARVLFQQLETLTIDVPAEVRVPAGRDQARLLFVEGPQEVTADLLVDLLYTIGLDGDDVELGSRHLAFWDALLEVYDDPSALADAFESAGAAVGESDAAPQQLASFMASLAELSSEKVTITALPVRPISVGDSQLYATDAEELTAFIDDTIGTRNTDAQEVRVQLLNGNGVPGIGREAAAKLVGEGFRVILGGNARRLDYRKTLVIAYDSSDEGIALAERARELLGVGEVQVSVQEQGIVDLTIVVGKDFLRAR